tara:strand:- start:79 stop:846 length:768 start_codon:yes stop_codon:yes gene_type:complete
MSDNKTIEIKPIKASKKYHVKQSKYDVAGKTPLRTILCGPSGAGKGILLQNMILDIYKDCFDRICIWSPSIHLDSNWAPVKDYIINTYGEETEDNRYFYEKFVPEEMEKEILIQKQVIQHLKDKGKTKMFSCLYIIDDFLDDVKVSRNSPLIHQLFIRGRHSYISTIVSTQKYNGLAVVARINSCELYVFRLRSNKELETIIEETSALVDKQTLLKIYRKCTEEPYSFLYIKLNAPTRDQMFYCRYDHAIKFSSD